MFINSPSIFKNLRISLLSCVFLVLALVGSAVEGASAQDTARLNRLVQGNTASSPSMVIFREGRDLIAEESWPKAARVFNDFVRDYPNDKNVDAAWYWLSFALKKEGKFQEADASLERLITGYPRSSWVNDARAMRAEIAPQLGTRGTRILQESAQTNNDEVKILALQSLMTLDAQRGMEQAANILKSGSANSVRLKGAALSLMGRYGGKAALPVLSGMARNETDPTLRKRAISALGGIDDDGALEPLREQALTAKEAAIVEAALAAIGQNSSPRAVVVLGEIAQNGQLTTTTRKYAIAYIARRRGEPSVDELLKIYDSNPPNEIRRQVVAGFGMRKSPRAQERLIVIAKGADTPELRAAAVSALTSRGDGPITVLDALLPIFDGEKSDMVRSQIIDVLARSQDKRAQAKLMEVAKNTSTPVETRKRAVMALSRSKDPEVLRFLEDLLK
jgi:HEAT repeat protein